MNGKIVCFLFVCFFMAEDYPIVHMFHILVSSFVSGHPGVFHALAVLSNVE